MHIKFIPVLEASRLLPRSGSTVAESLSSLFAALAKPEIQSIVIIN
jgi:hypothetical protein